MEVAEGIHRIEVPLGDRFVCVYLIETALGLVLLDSGLNDTPQEYVLPYLRDKSWSSHDLRAVIVSHADIDHCGGNQSIKELAPASSIISHFADRPLVEDFDLMVNRRYREMYDDHDLGETDDSLAWMRRNIRTAPVDAEMTGTERFRVKNGDWLQVLHTPGHSLGHISFYIPSSKTAIIADAVLHSAVTNSDGTVAFPPTYRYVEAYLATIRLFELLDIDVLLTSHFPVFRKNEVKGFLQTSKEFVQRADLLVSQYLQNQSAPRTLLQIIRDIHPALGKWPSGTERALMYPLLGHLEKLTKERKVLVDDTAAPITFRAVPSQGETDGAT